VSLKVYNTLSRKKESFKPVMRDKVRMYVCGPTVYNYISIGNARPIIVFDMVRNYLEYKGYEVIYIQNITDIEDKIINKAREEGVDFRVITRRYIDAFLEDIKMLKVGKFNQMPLASEMIEEIINIIQKIIENGFGYTVDGNVYFDVKKFARYGKLSGQKIEEIKEQEDDGFKKRNRVDFALWKSAKPDEPFWDSPWGRGRPGWHIECSAMATKYLGYGIDIHGGGIDLVFPHHENEIAQSEAAFPKKGDFVKYWMHNGMIMVKDEKMSKSSGLKEYWILKNLLKTYSPNIIKMYVLSTHYRSPLEFGIEKLEDAKKALERFMNTLRNTKFLIEDHDNETLVKEDWDAKDDAKDIAINIKSKIDNLVEKCREDFIKSMDDDFNSAKAIGHLFDLVRNMNSIIQSSDFRLTESIKESLNKSYQVINELGQILGFNFEEEILRVSKNAEAKVGISKEEIEKLIRLREEARKRKDYKKADEIRDKLYRSGILLEDRKEGTIWRLKEDIGNGRSL